MKRRNVLLAILSSPLAWLGFRSQVKALPPPRPDAGEVSRVGDLIQVKFNAKGEIANYDKVMERVPFVRLVRFGQVCDLCTSRETSVWIERGDAIHIPGAGHSWGKMRLQELLWSDGERHFVNCFFTVEKDTRHVARPEFHTSVRNPEKYVAQAKASS